MRVYRRFSSLCLTLLAACALALPAPVAAQSACTSGTLASYAALGSTGCSVGSAVFANFTVSTADLARAASVTLTPFTNPLTGGRSVSAFIINYGDAVSASAGSGGASLAVSASAAVASGALVGGWLGNPLGFYSGTGGSYYTDLTVGGIDFSRVCTAPGVCTGPTTQDFSAVPVSPFAFTGGVTTAGTGGLVIAVAGVLTTPAASVVPEPSTYLLLGAGLAMLGAVARRRVA